MKFGSSLAVIRFHKVFWFLEKKEHKMRSKAAVTAITSDKYDHSNESSSLPSHQLSDERRSRQGQRETPNGGNQRLCQGCALRNRASAVLRRGSERSRSDRYPAWLQGIARLYR